MFLGEYTHAIDEKGRLTIPAKFREALAGGAVVTRGFDRNLLIYTAADFAQLSQRAGALSPTDPENRALRRLIFSGASDTELDKQGRINIPVFLRQYALLDGESVIVGAGDFVEVWSRAGWDEQLQIVNDPGVNARRFAALDFSTDAASAGDEG